jgi:hypothetical protein
MAVLRIGLLTVGISAAAGSVTALAAQQAADVQETGAVTGQVLHAQTGEPIPNAHILVQGPHAVC